MLRRAAMGHSKYRDMFALLAAEIDSEKREVLLRFAREWSRKDINGMPSEIAGYHKQLQWGDTWTNQSIGQHIINDLKKTHDMPVRIITTQRQLKDPRGIERIEVMDEFEMVQFALEIKQNNQIGLPEKPSRHMKKLIEQVPIFSEHKTEARVSDYYAPGEEYDHFTRALVTLLFSVRNILKGGDGSIVAGPLGGKKNMVQRDPEAEFAEALPNAPSEGFW